MLLPENGPPVSAGEILVEEFLKPLGVSQRRFAVHLGWPQSKLNEVIRGKRSVTPETALAFSDALGTSPDLWLNAQRALDLWKAMREHTPIARFAGG